MSRNIQMLEYWQDVIRDSLSEHALSASEEQIQAIALDCYDCRDTMSEAFPGASAAGPARETEEERLRKQLRAEQEKRGCTHCGGRGSWQVPVGASHWSTETCGKCGGSGKV